MRALRGAGKCQRVKGGVLCEVIPHILLLLNKPANRTALVKCGMRTNSNNLVIPGDAKNATTQPL